MWMTTPICMWRVCMYVYSLIDVCMYVYCRNVRMYLCMHMCIFALGLIVLYVHIYTYVSIGIDVCRSNCMYTF